jgi:hypothetical protein
MIAYYIALFWALLSPVINHTNSTSSCNQQVTVMDDPGDGGTGDPGDGDTGGETGTIPPKPPKP